jgi:hypothetical protein
VSVPAQLRSVSVTAAYRDRVTGIRARVIQRAQREWPAITDLDQTGWVDRMATVVAAAQAEGVRAAAGYLTAYLTSEQQRPARAIRIDASRYAGVSRDGRALRDALRSPLIGTYAALKDGRPPEDALRIGLARATRMVSIDVDHANRTALLDAIAADDRFAGWERATAGTCGACMALSGTTGSRFRVHPGCNCQPQPIVAGAPNNFPLLTGVELFRRMTREEQDAQFGPDKADALRTGAVLLADLVAISELETQDDFVTEAPLDAAT